jgi:hypothetical protein
MDAPEADSPLNEQGSLLEAGDSLAATEAGGPGPLSEARQGLKEVARRVQANLAPVEPRADFLRELSRQLAAAWPQAEVEAARRARQKDQRLMWVAGAGGLLYLAGLVFLSVRAALAVGGRLAAVVGARGAPKAA